MNEQLFKHFKNDKNYIIKNIMKLCEERNNYILSETDLYFLFTDDLFQLKRYKFLSLLHRDIFYYLKNYLIKKNILAYVPVGHFRLTKKIKRQIKIQKIKDGT